MACILWCYLRNSKFKTADGDMHAAADLTGQANHLGVTIQADIVKQKLPERTAAIRRSRKSSASLTARPASWFTRSLPIIQSTSSAIRWPMATWDASADQFRWRVERRRLIWPQRSVPR